MLASALHPVLEEAGTFLHPKPTCLANNQDAAAAAWYAAQKKSLTGGNGELLIREKLLVVVLSEIKILVLLPREERGD